MTYAPRAAWIPAHERRAVAPLINRDDASAELARDLLRAIGAAVVRDHDLGVDPVRTDRALRLLDAGGDRCRPR